MSDNPFKSVPVEMQELPQWVLWRLEQRGTKPTKIPVSVTSSLASSTDPATWTTFDHAVEVWSASQDRIDGIGFVFIEGGGMFGVDLDDCIDDTGTVCENAKALLDTFFTYSEVSPSGHGVKMFCRGTLPTSTGKNVKNPEHPSLAGIGGVEAYSHGRYFTVTGRHVDGSPDVLVDCSAAAADLLAKLAKAPRPPAPVPNVAPPRAPAGPGRLSAVERCRLYVRKLPDAISGQGGHNRTLEAAATCFRFGLPMDEARQVMDEFNATKTGGEPWSDAELIHKLDSALEKVTMAGEFGKLRDESLRIVRSEAQPSLSTEESEPTTDDGSITVGWLADQFVKHHGHIIRFCPQAGNHLVWDGKRWAEDDTNQAARLACDTLRRVRYAAADERDEQRRKRMFALGSSLDSAAGYQQLLDTAATKPGMCVRIADLDTDNNLLNTESGIVDLRTGEQFPHDPKRMMTRICGAAYEPGSSSVLWEEFLTKMLPDDDLRAFVQRAAGYSLTGTAQEEALLIVHGPTAAGKSTFADAARAAAGDYSAVADVEAFLAKPANGGARSDIARLAKRRIVIGSEVDEGARLAQGLVKALTGGDTITARYLYREPFEFLPTFVIWLLCNHAPRVPHDDDACWRRIHVVPFTVSLPPEERDPTVKHRLRTDPETKAAVLTWMIEGAVQWHKTGLRAPDAVRLATVAYRRDQDELADFITDYCRTGPGLWEASKDLRQAYELYCRDAGILRPLSPKVFWPRLTSLGFANEKRDGVRGWRGICAIRTPFVDSMDSMDGCFENSRVEKSMGEFTESGVPAVHAVHNRVSDEEMAMLASLRHADHN